MATDERTALAAEAFAYGFPLVFDLEQVHRFVRSGISGIAPTPFNQFGHAGELAGPDATFVSINNDTVYSIAQVDLSGGPLRLDVPDTHGRYYVLQFVDAWTNNFAYVGQRATGTGAGSFLLLPPGDECSTDAGLRAIRCPTSVVSIVGRWAVSGEADLPAVANLQGLLTITPLEDRPRLGFPEPDASVSADIAFFERLRVFMRMFPPAQRDQAYQARFESLGLFEHESPYRAPDAGMLSALREGVARGQDTLEAVLRVGAGPKQNGWNLTYHVFDYNLDFFEIGAIDDPQWKLDTEPLLRYLHRAAAARAGLWGNHGYEAAYAMVYEDAAGQRLNGASRYDLRFGQTPPVGAFWSVTMYDASDFFLVANPIGRHSIGDRTPGIHTADDGSLTIVLQKDEPVTPEARANWLPTPDGDYRPILRMYEPDTSVFDGRYELPPITKRS
jgi:hypothetical protein